MFWTRNRNVSETFLLRAQNLRLIEKTDTYLFVGYFLYLHPYNSKVRCYETRPLVQRTSNLLDSTVLKISKIYNLIYTYPIDIVNNLSAFRHHLTFDNGWCVFILVYDKYTTMSLSTSKIAILNKFGHDYWK